MESAY